MNVVASFGGGVNSTAMLLGMNELGERPPDLILFADTGGEKAETYRHVEEMSKWLKWRLWPEITVVREERFTLEQECLTAHTLPSIVMGMRSCSDKFKIRPQERYLKSLGVTEHMKLIGFDASEPHRVGNYSDQRRYPLIEWGWGRDECVATIRRHGLAIPPKSSCFFCPEMEEQEILSLGRTDPALLNRALAMEKNATKLVHIKGLARTHSWQQVIDYHRDQQTMLMPPRANHIPCTCYDGEA